MKEVSKREFQINFYAYTRYGEEVRVYGRGGEVVGVWTPTVKNAVQEEDVELKPEKTIAVHNAVHVGVTLPDKDDPVRK
jgi:hypothetical protein